MKARNEDTKARRRANGEGAIRQRPNGLWEARALVAGKRRSIYGKTKREVVEKLAENRTDAKRGRFTEPSRVTLGAFLDYWLEAVASQGLRPLTVAIHRGHVETYIKPRIGGVRLQQITPATVNRLLADLAAEKVTANLRRSVRKTLHRALRVAVEELRMMVNPVTAAVLPKVETKKRRALTDEERARLIAAAQASGPRLAALVTLALDSGLRYGELAALQWGDVEEGAVQVRRSLREEKLVRDDAKKRVGGGLIEGPPKTKAALRAVPLTAAAQAALRELRASLPVTPMPMMPVFTAPDGGRLRKSNFGRREWTPLRKAAGVPLDYPFHGLRHTFVTRLARQGVSVKTAQALAGHSSPDMTLRVYTHVVSADLTAAIELL